MRQGRIVKKKNLKLNFQISALKQLKYMVQNWIYIGKWRHYKIEINRNEIAAGKKVQ